MIHQAFLGLGSNVGDSSTLLSNAINLIDISIGNIKKSSSLIETKPWGYISDNNYLNGVVLVETELTPDKILDKTLYIEKSLGRVRDNTKGYKDRPIDIDILLIDDLVIKTKTLTVPHPLMHLRKFVLEPLLEIAPNLIHPETNIPFIDYLKSI